MWRIEISEIVETQVRETIQGSDFSTDVLIKRYVQTVDVIDLKAVIAVVNKVARRPRTKKGDAA